MTIVAVGIDHRNTPLGALHATAPDEAAIADIVRRARQLVPEAFVLATCNRIELYGFARAQRPVAQEMREILADTDVKPSASRRRWNGRDATILRTGRRAVRHLLRVASGLESSVVGETNIVAQLRATLELAQRSHSVGPFLHRLLMQSLRTEKIVRTAAAAAGNTNRSTVSATLRTALAARDLKRDSVVVIGAGRLAQDVLWHVARLRPRRTVVVNRTMERAAALAQRFAASAAAWEQRHHALSTASVAISCVPGTTRPFTADELRTVRQPCLRPLIAIDFGVPPGLDPSIGELPNVRLITPDDVARRVATASHGEVYDLPAHLLIENGVDEYVAWYRGRRAAPIVAALQQSGDRVREAEVARALRRLPALTDRERRVIENLADRIVSKLLHPPIVAVKSAGTRKADGAGV